MVQQEYTHGLIGGMLAEQMISNFKFKFQILEFEFLSHMRRNFLAVRLHGNSW